MKYRAATSVGLKSGSKTGLAGEHGILYRPFILSRVLDSLQKPKELGDN